MDQFIIACSGPGAGAAITEAERFAFVASCISIPLLLAAAGLSLLGRNNIRACCLNLVPLMVHPVWSITARGGDCGTTLRLLSAIWIPLSVVLIINALGSIRRNGLDNARSTCQFSLRTFRMCCVLVVLIIAAVSSPIADFLPLMGLLTVIVIAAWPKPLRSGWRTLPQHVGTPDSLVDTTKEEAR